MLRLFLLPDRLLVDFAAAETEGDGVSVGLSRLEVGFGAIFGMVPAI